MVINKDSYKVGLVIPARPISSNDYKDFQCSIFQVPYIVDNQKEIIEHCSLSVERIKDCIHSWKGTPREEISGRDMTMFYGLYSIYSISAPSQHFYNIYLAVSECVSRYYSIHSLPSPKQVWMQSWLNFHDYHEVLDKHSHGFQLHGFVSIDPKDTETVFFDSTEHSKEVYKVSNGVGKIYLGPGNRPHYVHNLNHWDGKRITMGFDIIETNVPMFNLGAIPINLECTRL